MLTLEFLNLVVSLDSWFTITTHPYWKNFKVSFAVCSFLILWWKQVVWEGQEQLLLTDKIKRWTGIQKVRNPSILFLSVSFALVSSSFQSHPIRFIWIKISSSLCIVLLYINGPEKEGIKSKWVSIQTTGQTRDSRLETSSPRATHVWNTCVCVW